MVTSTRFSGINYRIVLFCLLAFASVQLFNAPQAAAQIWEPEGLNMPGGWNGWTNPPANNLALASYTQLPGGRVTKISTGIPRWQTVFSVAASGSDIVGGTYEWLFTSGPSGSPWNNKWSNTNATINTLQTYTKEGPANNTITVTNGKWYTMNYEDAGYTNTRAIFMETSAEPVSIATVSVPATVNQGVPATITITTSLAPSAGELFYLRYTTDAWATSVALPVTMTLTSGTATIPGMSTGTTVSYYAFSSTVPAITDNFDLYSIKLNANGGANYAYTVSAPPAAIPTLSEWALILLAVFLLGVGGFYIMQRRQVC
ncbi:MAG: IPTL-CTERM sorting domain-containing protein [Bacteroidales bacterium]